LCFWCRFFEKGAFLVPLFYFLKKEKRGVFGAAFFEKGAL